MFVIRNKKRFQQLYGEHKTIELETLLILLNQERIKRTSIANTLQVKYTWLNYWVVSVDK